MNQLVEGAPILEMDGHSALPVLHSGTRIGDRYVVVRPLGEGGMGQVFEVEHEAIGRHFALKILNIKPCTDEVLRRFRREARALGRVATPRVAQVTDFGYEPHLGPFYVMELLDGETLEDRLEREHHVSPHEALPIVIDLCQALGEVHAAGIIHRDLKPSNVGLVRTGPMRVKLLDFGLAAAADDAMLDRITRSQEVVGSLPYMAPERFHNQPLTFSVDLYAVGVVLFEMLTGQLPFQGTSAAILINQHLNEAPLPFAAVAPGLDIAPSVEAVVMRLLDKDPDERFLSSEAVARALQATTIDVPIPTLSDVGDDVATASTVFGEDSVEFAAQPVGGSELSSSDPASGSGADEADDVESEDVAKTYEELPPATAMPATQATEGPAVAAASAQGSHVGVPTSIVESDLGSWPRSASPVPSGVAAVGSDSQAAGLTGRGWASGPVPPTTFEPSAAYPPAATGRPWVKIVAILAAGVVGSTLAALLAILVFLPDDPPPSPPDAPEIPAATTAGGQVPPAPLPPSPPSVASQPPTPVLPGFPQPPVPPAVAPGTTKAPDAGSAPATTGPSDAPDAGVAAPVTPPRPRPVKATRPPPRPPRPPPTTYRPPPRNPPGNSSTSDWGRPRPRWTGGVITSPD